MPSEYKPKDLDDNLSNDLNIKIDDDFDGQTQSNQSFGEDEEEEEEYYEEDVQNEVLFDDFEKAFDNMLEQEEDIQDAEDLNQRFLAQQLGVEAIDIALLEKIELRVDTSCHNLQVTGETL